MNRLIRLIAALVVASVWALFPRTVVERATFTIGAGERLTIRYRDGGQDTVDLLAIASSRAIRSFSQSHARSFRRKEPTIRDDEQQRPDGLRDPDAAQTSHQRAQDVAEEGG